jgi:hypothetical protein
MKIYFSKVQKMTATVRFKQTRKKPSEEWYPENRYISVSSFSLFIFSNKLGIKISNGHSPANLSNSSTRQKFASFGEFEYSPKWPFWKIGRTRYIRPRLTFAIFEKNVTRLDTFARVIRHFGEFGASGHCLN